MQKKKQAALLSFFIWNSTTSAANEPCFILKDRNAKKRITLNILSTADQLLIFIYKLFFLITLAIQGCFKGKVHLLRGAQWLDWCRWQMVWLTAGGFELSKKLNPCSANEMVRKVQMWLKGALLSFGTELSSAELRSPTVIKQQKFEGLGTSAWTPGFVFAIGPVNSIGSSPIHYPSCRSGLLTAVEGLRGFRYYQGVPSILNRGWSQAERSHCGMNEKSLNVEVNHFCTVLSCCPVLEPWSSFPPHEIHTD